jgi:hypothetical protein
MRVPFAVGDFERVLKPLATQLPALSNRVIHWELPDPISALGIKVLEYPRAIDHWRTTTHYKVLHFGKTFVFRDKNEKQNRINPFEITPYLSFNKPVGIFSNINFQTIVLNQHSLANTPNHPQFPLNFPNITLSMCLGDHTLLILPPNFQFSVLGKRDISFIFTDPDETKLKRHKNGPIRLIDNFFHASLNSMRIDAKSRSKITKNKLPKKED